MRPLYHNALLQLSAQMHMLTPLQCVSASIQCASMQVLQWLTYPARAHMLAIGL